MGNSKKRTFRGKLQFYFETGTEGGYWAFQDENYSGWQKPIHGVWHGDKVALRDNPAVVGEVVHIEHLNKTDVMTRGVSRDEIVKADIRWEDENADLPDEVTSDRLLVYRESYDGLKILRSGDYLRVYNDENNCIFDGAIYLIEYPPFREHALGYWIHSDQRGQDREEWANMFFAELDAELTTDE